MSIVFKNVEISKNNFTILSDFNFQLKNNENVVVLGESGSGKSTFLDAIAGSVFPTKGKIEKDKTKKIVSVNRDYSFHRLVGPVYQYYQQRFNSQDAELGPTVYEVLQNQVIPVGTINENSVEIKPPLYSEDWLGVIVQKLKLEHLVHQKITSLSNGETRRTLIANALLKKPDILLLDNPFTGLDIKSRGELKLLLSDFTETQIILIANAHDIPEKFEKVVFLEKGKLSFFGKLAEFIPKAAINYSIGTEILKKIENLSIPQFSSFETAIKINDGHVRYGNKLVLQGINWEVKKGEKWALMGPNGSGKSSLLSLITGDNPQCYQNQLYLFDKKRGSGESIWDLKQKMGFVSPELHLYFNKNSTVWKVVASGFFDSAGLFQKLTEQQLELTELYLDLVNLFEVKDRKLNQLSFGQQRLVFLARALVKNPALLILDEPCQGLDYNQMVFFRTILNEIAIHQNKTLLFVTHYEDEIPLCINKRLNLFEGKELKL
ncbi:ATP-binding cassette domain-containing protein [Lacihabitans sp. CCS-44]|uniref:ATP-binding cassette domain-containing protein n=1 Tax=Lacihabitans sp. CCS-44 TaxID=2487331 RepID=UPI0020CEAC59|nr:ATP-binding cassette domain-containing protein [Lacihabitans sp. CCS-44]MCP9755331.1 ATP-binding cassette domain-containing protein [Lacihabitans sp. CCS-44]